MHVPVCTTELQQLIVRILQSLQRDVYRTQLVKMIYFTDYIYYRHEGHTLTGLQYIWDQFGPNAIDNQIVQEADQLAQLCVIHVRRVSNVYGDYSYLYHTDSSEIPAPTLNPFAELILADVIQKYGNYSPAAIAKASKQTAPFRHAHQGDILGFGEPCPVPSEPLDEARRAVLDADEGASLEELRAEYSVA